MDGERRSVGLGTLLALVFAVSGCERGCLGRWLEEHGIGGAAPESPGGGAPQGKRRSLDLSGTDCSDGLLRCRDGRVEASRAAHLPHPCGSRKPAEQGSACDCPWDFVATCPSGCAIEGLDVFGGGGANDGGAAQLCRPDVPVARPFFPGDPVPNEICASEHVACVDGIVRTCERPGQPVRPLAICLFGCQPHVGVDIEPGEPVNLDGLASILCQRDQAERR